MFNDAKEELERLEAALRQAEQSEEDSAQADEDILDDELLDALLDEDGRIADAAPEELYNSNYSNRRKNVRIYNSDSTDVDPEELSEEVLAEAGQKGITGLVVTAVVLTAGILGLAVYWLLRYGGVL